MTNKIDKENLREIIRNYPDQFAAGIKLAKRVTLKGKRYTSVTISGMGGSALPGDLLDLFISGQENLSETAVPRIIINRTYNLPGGVSRDSLNLIASYSGITEESLSSLKEAIEHKLDTIGISSGGTVETLCKRHGIPHLKIPSGIQPRMATGYFFGVYYQLLINLLLFSDQTALIEKLCVKLKGQQATLEMEGKKLARKLIGKTPLIYTSDKLKTLARNWKIKINENAKTPAFWNFFPELDHNEINGFINPQGKFFGVMLRDPNDHPRSKKRFTITQRLMKEEGVSSIIIDIPKAPIFYQIFWALSLGDWTSYYLALAYRQDPTPVEMVERLKKLMK